MSGAIESAAGVIGEIGGGFGAGLTEEARGDVRRGVGEQQRYYREAEGIIGAGGARAEEPLRPYSQTGGNALRDLYAMARGEWDFETDPGYAFRRGEGERAIERAAGTSTGGPGRYSGATLKALAQYGQNFASNEYNRAYNRRAGTLAPVAQMGYGAAGQMADLRMRTAEGEAGYRAGVGEAAGAGAVAEGNLRTDATTGLFQGIGRGAAAYYGAG